tara:strand:- start:3791 stop:4426 length:636 start_codon:yes stop_codon:yes gene_type:complete
MPRGQGYGKQPSKGKKRRVMVRKPTGKTESLSSPRERSQIRVIQKAADANEKKDRDPRDKSVGMFTRSAVRDRMRRGDIKLAKNDKMKPAGLMQGVILNKDKFESFDTESDKFGSAPSGRRNTAIVRKPTKRVRTARAGEVDSSQPHEAFVQANTGVDTRTTKERFLRSFDKGGETMVLGGSDRDAVLKRNFETGSGEKPKDKRRKKIRVL